MTKIFVDRVKDCKYDDISCICLERHTLRGRSVDIFDDNQQIIGNKYNSSLSMLINY